MFLVISMSFFVIQEKQKDTMKMGGEQGPDNAVLPLVAPLFYREGVYRACLL